MSTSPRILAFAGSLRSDSFNKKLVRYAANAAEKKGATVTVIDLRDLDLPIYDQDLEDKSGLPEGATKLKKLMKEHDALMIASPEYNSSLSAALKNAIDWASRPEGDSTPLEAFNGKVAGIMAASPGALGGLRGLFHLRSILSNINVIVLPQMHAIAKAGDVFDDSGNITDDNHAKKITRIAETLTETAGKLKA
ncbi:MAG: NADPH-dependent oxidoreductase [Phycisphaerales bacterium]|nr:MAG: NADPH-dependent oxidoreductase [Phycisphaerales bacterium]